MKSPARHAVWDFFFFLALNMDYLVSLSRQTNNNDMIDFLSDFKQYLQSIPGQECAEKFIYFNFYNILVDFNEEEADNVAYSMMQYDLAAFSKLLEGKSSPESLEEACSLYEEVIDGLVPCVDPADGDYIMAGDHPTMLSAIVPLSFVLANFAPRYFFHNLFRYRAYSLQRISQVFDIQLPQKPGKRDFRGRLMYYWQLCEVFYHFRMVNEMTSLDLEVFLNGYARPFISEAHESLKPSAVWWMGRKETLGEKMKVSFSRAEKRIREGDLIFRYNPLPEGRLVAVWNAWTDAVIDPFYKHYSNTYLVNKKELPAITLAELKADPYFGNHTLAKRNFLSSEGYRLSDQDYKELLRMLKEKGWDTTTE